MSFDARMGNALPRSWRLECLQNHRWQTIFLVCFSLMIAVPLLLTTLAPYDDEGYVMMTLKSFLENHPLYEDTYTQYGPSFYLLTAPLHNVLGYPLTHHAVRLKTALLWVVPVLLTMGIMLKLSGNRLLSLTTSCMVAVHLGRLALEPGHPQEVSLLMNMVGLWLLCDRSPRRWWMAGCCAAICGMCKLNVGFVMTSSLLLAACIDVPEPKWIRRPIMLAVWALASLAVGATMLKANQGNIGLVVPIVMIVSWLAIALLASRQRSTPVRATYLRGFRPLIGTLASGLLVTFFIALWARVNGTSWSMLAWGIVGQHHAHAKYFFHPIPLSIFTVLAALLVVASYRNQRWLGIVGMVCLVIAIAKAAGNAILPLNYNCQEGAEWLAVIGPCFAPGLLMYRRRMVRGRVMLAGMTVLGPWIAYPIAGTQLMLGALPGWLTIGVVVSDSIQAMVFAMKDKSLVGHPKVVDAIYYTRLLLVGALIAGSASSIVSTSSWIFGTSLGLRGCEWIHVAPHEAEAEQKLVRDIIETGASHLVFDGHTLNRFYFWTDLKPLTNANATLWPFMLSPNELTKLRNSVERTQSLCVVVPPDVPAPRPDATGNAAEARWSLYEGTHFDSQHANGWLIGFRSK
jgi:hypothetical protein